MATCTLLQAPQRNHNSNSNIPDPSSSLSTTTTTTTNTTVHNNSTIDAHPEILGLLSKYLDLKSLISCSQVCQSWSLVSTPHIWYSVDFTRNSGFKDLEPEIVTKHGHHIRDVKNVRRRSDLDMLIMEPNVHKVERLMVRLKPKRAGFQLQAVRLIKRNLATLKKLTLTGVYRHGTRTNFELMDELFSPATVKAAMAVSIPAATAAAAARKRDEGGRGEGGGGLVVSKRAEGVKKVIMAEEDTAVVVPRMTELIMKNVSMPRSAFSTLLAACPYLTDIGILSCDFLEPTPVEDDGHQGESISVKEEQAQDGGQRQDAQAQKQEETGTTQGQVKEGPLEQGQQQYQQQSHQGHQHSKQPSSHPHFHHLGVQNLLSSIDRVFHPNPKSKHSASLLAHFPNLEVWDTWYDHTKMNKTMTSKFKQEIRTHCPKFRGLYINRSPKDITPILLKTVYGIMLYSSTLKVLQAYCPEDKGWSYHADRVIPLAPGRKRPSDAWMMELVLSKCPKVEFLNLPGHEVDLALAEEGGQFEWACKDLTELRIRIKGVDTQKLIKSVIDKWGQGVISQSHHRIVEMEDKDTQDEDKEDYHRDNCSSSSSSSSSSSMDAKEEKEQDDSTRDVQETDRLLVERAAKFLLQFEKLTNVWLGYKIWTVGEEAQPAIS
ncbi:hypothetical protein EDD11_003668 [Mortierella claussenii]|nr:hypothetical protein EDD11_003668 [Mortierella claussenii]